MFPWYTAAGSRAPAARRRSAGVVRGEISDTSVKALATERVRERLRPPAAPRPAATAPTDAPAGAQSPTSRRPDSWLRRAAASFWIEALFWSADHAPWLVRGLRGFFCSFAFRFSRVIRTATLANAARLLGPQSSSAERVRLAKAVLRSFYFFCYDVGRCSHFGRDELLKRIESTDGEAHYDAARAAGKGAIVVTAHMGSFEVGLAALTAREAARGKRVHVVFRRDDHDRFDRQRSALRDRLGAVEAPVNDGWPVWLRLRDALANDEVVVMQADRVMPGQKGVRVPLLGGHVELPTGPVRLAQLSGAPIIPVFTVRRPDGRIRLFVEPAITVGPDDATSGRNDTHPAVLRTAAVLEKYLAAYPDQWLMFQPAWCEDIDALRAAQGGDARGECR